MKTLQLLGSFATRIEGLDLMHANSEELRELMHVLYRAGVVIVPGQLMSEADYIAFGRRLGKLKIFVDPEYRHPEYPEIFVVSNIKENGNKFGMDRVGYYWHSDCSFLSEPQPITSLYSKIVPEFGGETAFIDMRQVFRELPLELKSRLHGRQCLHEGQTRYIITESDVGLSVKELLERDRNTVPPVPHPAVIKHPITGEIALYVSEGFTERVLDIPPEESKSWLKICFEATESSHARYLHHWEKNQVILWDNRTVVHRAYPAAHGGSRLLFRLGVIDGDFFGDNRQ